MNRSFLLACLLMLPGAPGFSRPNIVLIISDDAGYADFGFMDALTSRTTEVPTPELDTLRARGTLFSSAYTGSVCSPSRAAITTGFYQNRLGYEYNINNLTSATARDGHFPETVTVFEWMKHLGYATGAIGKWHIGAMADDGAQPGNRPERQGVDTFLGLWGGSRTYDVGVATLGEHLLRRTDVAPDGTITSTVLENEAPWSGMNLTVALGEAAQNFITDRHEAVDESGNPVPFFLYVAFTAPHGPLHQSPDYNDPRISGISDTKRRQYASMILTMDKAVGGILERLNDPDRDGDPADSIMDNTFFVFINDNGGPSSNASSNYPLRGYKGNPEEGGIRVPMFMAGAGIPVGGVYDFPVHSIDFVPTFARLAGGTDETTVDGVRLDSLDGIDIRPYLNGSINTPPHDLIVVRKDDRVGLRKGDWKLTAFNQTFRLYNLANDIGESQNLAFAEPDILDDLIHELNLFDAGSDKPRHAALNAVPESINLNDGFIANPPTPGGAGFIPDLVIAGGSILNGDFNTSTEDGRGTFEETPDWINIGTGAQTQPATNTNLDFDGTRNAILAKTDLRIFGLDTGYTLLGGEVFHTRYQWLDATDWTDGSDRVAVTLFITDDDTINGNRTVMETALSGLSVADNSYQMESHVFAPVEVEFSGKRLFVQVNPEVSGVGFGRFDNFVLERGEVGGQMLSQFSFGDPNRWKDGDTGLPDTLLSLDSFPGAELTFPSRTFNYTAINNLTRASGLEFMLNRLVFEGTDSSTTTLGGMALAFADDLDAAGAHIGMNRDSGSVVLYTDLLLIDDLHLTGTGSGTLEIGGAITDERDPRHLFMEGPFTVRFTKAPANAGQIVVNAGTLSLPSGVDISASSAVVIESGGRISGKGRVTSPLAIRGAFLAGDGTEPFSAENLTLDGARLEVPDLGGEFPAAGLVVATYNMLAGEFASASGVPAGYHIEYDSDAGGGQPAIVIVPNTPFDDWTHSVSGLSGAAATFGADPNEDGVVNGMAYLLGMEDALVNAEGALPSTSLEPASLIFQFNRLKNTGGVAARVAGSLDMSNWSILENGVDGVVIEVADHQVDANLESVTVRLPAAPAQFLRLQAVEQ